MNNHSKIIELIGKQRIVFEEVEDITNKIIYEQIEEFPQLMEKREELLKKSLLIKEEINKVAAIEPGVLNVLSLNCDISRLSDENAMVFEALMRVRATANRINRMDSEVYSRIEREKSSILEYIETLNSSGNSVAENYKRAVQTAFSGNRFDGDKKITV